MLSGEMAYSSQDNPKTKLEEILEIILSTVNLQDLKSGILKLQEKFYIDFNFKLDDRSQNLTILASLISSLLDDEFSDWSEENSKKIQISHTEIQGVDFCVCPQQGCDVKYSWNCFRHLKNHTMKDHGFDVSKVRKRRPIDQLKESTKRQYKYCPPSYFDQKEKLQLLKDTNLETQDQDFTVKIFPILIDGQEYYTCPKDECHVKYSNNSFRQLKKHAQKEHSLDLVKERKRRPVELLKESTKRQYKYCPPKHYEDRVKVELQNSESESSFYIGFQDCQKVENVHNMENMRKIHDMENKNGQVTRNYLRVVNNLI